MKKPILMFLAVVAVGWFAYGDGAYIKRTILDGANASVVTTNISGVFTNTAGTNNVIKTNSYASTNVNQYARLSEPILVNASSVGFFSSCKLTGSGTTGPGFTLQKSYDGTNWEAALTISNTVVNGTALAAMWTNFTLNQFGYVRVSEATNYSATRDITNLIVRWYVKENL